MSPGLKGNAMNLYFSKTSLCVFTKRVRMPALPSNSLMPDFVEVIGPSKDYLLVEPSRPLRPSCQHVLTMLLPIIP